MHGGHAHAIGPINFATITAFLAWFGGTGYLLTNEFRWLALPAVGAVDRRRAASAPRLVFLLMAKVLWSPNENMQSADYHMVGVLGRLSQPIREGGIGELIYSHGGARQVVRRAQRRRPGHRERRGSRRHGVRAGHRVGASDGTDLESER